MGKRHRRWEKRIYPDIIYPEEKINTLLLEYISENKNKSQNTYVYDNRIYDFNLDFIVNILTTVDIDTDVLSDGRVISGIRLSNCRLYLTRSKSVDLCDVINHELNTDLHFNSVYNVVLIFVNSVLAYSNLFLNKLNVSKRTILPNETYIRMVKTTFQQFSQKIVDAYYNNPEFKNIFKSIIFKMIYDLNSDEKFKKMNSFDKVIELYIAPMMNSIKQKYDL